MAENNKDLKQLKIKTAALKRIQKEFFGYQKEELKQNERIQKLKDQNADEADIKKQEEVLQETVQMYPNIIGRLVESVNELQVWLDGKINDPLIDTSEEKTKALETIVEAQEFLKANNPAQ
ncbi:unnamed protein product [Paramecium pentaurelia]|uniref:Tubulin-specific chaperone A n=1 Tax=Paramecium pentaurelia TaxID=43138 RepID=A0A8S1TFR3_9CILI|nr:unnamed protein product [Paramecium pentaurelia]